MFWAAIRQAHHGHNLKSEFGIHCVNNLAFGHKKLVETAALFHTDRQEGWADVAPANPVRSERKQPQWGVYGSSSLPLTFGVLVHLV